MKKYLLLPLALCSACGEEEPTPCDDSAGNICTIAGMGESGYSGDGGRALEARFSLPQDLLAAEDGTLYVLDWNNHRIRKITVDGNVELVAGRGELQLGVLIESMRREGFELSISRPRVVFQTDPETGETYRAP